MLIVINKHINVTLACSFEQNGDGLDIDLPTQEYGNECDFCNGVGE